ncbi:MAG TPA: exodeoxyribonuclease VII small subunit [Firmicutes bacterium]|jgi:exodeoxyribonuclease VII small subunit|nr:exodeoxyribonuclease VII small subunit [Bacillota bacterium]
MSDEKTRPEGELTYEEALERLEQIVASLEAGDVALEEALQKFESGVKLVRRCTELLDQAEKRIACLMEKEDGSVELVPLRLTEEGA